MNRKGPSTWYLVGVVILGPSGIPPGCWLKEPFGSAVEVIEGDEFLVIDSFRASSRGSHRARLWFSFMLRI